MRNCHVCQNTINMCLCGAYSEVFCLHLLSRARHSRVSVRESCEKSPHSLKESVAITILAVPVFLVWFVPFCRLPPLPWGSHQVAEDEEDDDCDSAFNGRCRNRPPRELCLSSWWLATASDRAASLQSSRIDTFPGFFPSSTLNTSMFWYRSLSSQLAM